MRRLLALLILFPWPCLGGGPQEQDAHRVPVDREHELPSAPPAPLPVLGPRQALVTLDLLQPLGVPAAASNVALALRLAREDPDLRLVYHPVPTTPVAERGAEVLWEALGQQRFWAACERLHARPELLGPDKEPALLEEAARLGLDAARLRDALAQKQHRGRVQELWRRDRGAVLTTPELWVNGRRLAGAPSETDLRDEIERQRERAQALLRQGVPLSQAYERLAQQERERSLPWLKLQLARMAQRPAATARAHVDLSGVPVRGPAVAPVTLVLFASLDTYSSRGYAELIRGVMEQHRGQLRLVVKPLATPGSYAGLQAAWYLLRLHERAPADFWRAYEALLAAAGRRFQLSAREIREVLQLARIDLTGVPQGPVPGPAQSLLEQNVAEAKRLGIDGPPALLVNGQLMRGSLTAESLEELVRRELELGLISRLREGAPSEN